MFRLVLLSLPVALFPLVAIHAVETVMTRSLLPEVATNMQRAAAGDAEQPRLAARADTAPVTAIAELPAVLPLTLRF